MNAPLPFLSVILALFATLAMGHGEPAAAPKLDPDEWKAKLQEATDIQRQALVLKKRIQQLREDPEQGDQAEIEGMENKKKELFIQAANRMIKLSEQTGDPKMSALCVMRAGQNLMRAEEYVKATAHFDKLAINKDAEAELRAQALFWNATSHERLKLMAEAKRLHKAITKEFPDSKWAKYARGRLADPVFQ